MNSFTHSLSETITLGVPTVGTIVAVVSDTALAWASLIGGLMLLLIKFVWSASQMVTRSSEAITVMQKSLQLMENHMDEQRRMNSKFGDRLIHLEGQVETIKSDLDAQKRRDE